MSSVSGDIDPALAAVFSMESWRARLAAFKSRAVPDDDPRVVECHAALAYWRVRKVIDAERASLRPEDADALADELAGSAEPDPTEDLREATEPVAHDESNSSSSLPLAETARGAGIGHPAAPRASDRAGGGDAGQSTPAAASRTLDASAEQEAVVTA